MTAFGQGTAAKHTMLWSPSQCAFSYSSSCYRQYCKTPIPFGFTSAKEETLSVCEMGLGPK